jgi:cation transport regulator ChaC
MSVNTINQNKERQSFHRFDEIWLFGYGSLIYKVDFPFIEKAPASIKGWQRRFWQGSHDHRGTPQQPGRVVTLIKSGLDECSGMAYKVTQDVFEHLDYREKNGYLRYEVDIYFKGLKPDRTDNADYKKGVIYIAHEDNAAFLGDASEHEIAQQIHRSSGLSGHNRDYVFQLAEALQALGHNDEHVIVIDRILKKLQIEFS